LACYAEGWYAEGWGQPSALSVYADDHVGSLEAYLARGATPTATLGVAYADGLSRLRRGRAAVSTR
jgi:alanine racemase